MSQPTAPVGVIVMAYGTPSSLNEIESYYTHIRRGRRPSDEELDRLTLRYVAIGGASAMATRTAAQVAAITAELDRRMPGLFRVTLGQKHAYPYIEDAVSSLANAGVKELIGVVLAPHFSQASVGEYTARMTEEASELGLLSRSIETWADLPEWVDFQAAAIRRACQDLPSESVVIFTAHSLPERVLVDDRYVPELEASAAAIAAAAGLADQGWEIGWQSAARTPEPWRGPDILTRLAQIGHEQLYQGVCVCPQGFVADHLEIGYDLDIDAARVANEAGLDFARTAMLNDDAVVFAALTQRLIDVAS